MTTVLHRKRTMLSVGILAAGAVAYSAVCLPAITRAAGRDTDPFYLALRYLWPFPIVLSAWFCGASRLRGWSIVGYVFVTAFPAAGASNWFLVPRYVDIVEVSALVVLWFFPFHLAVAPGLEWLTQRVLKLFRTFAETEEVSQAAGVLRRSRRTTLFVTLIITATVAFPVVYRQCVLARARWQGRRSALWAWEHGQAIRYVDDHEYLKKVGEQTYEVRDDARSLSDAVDSGWDPATGLKVDTRYGARYGGTRYGGIAGRMWVEAYREVINQKLAANGPAPTAKYLFTVPQMVALLASGRMKELTSSFWDHEKYVSADGEISYRNYPHSFLGVEPQFLYAVRLPEKGGVLVIASAECVVTYDPEGNMLQIFRDSVLDLEISEELLQGIEQPKLRQR